jgi:asparagine synthase (glutamine-hydrolysing)
MHLIISENTISYSPGTGSKSLQKSGLICWVSGYFRRQDTSIMFDDKAAEYALRLYERGELISQPEKLNGIFSLLLCDEAKKIAFIITDRLGTTPVFCGQIAGKVFVSDEFWQVVKDIGAHRLNRIAVSQLLQYTFVLGSQTLIEGITELPVHAVTALDYSRGPVLSHRNYWTYRLTEKAAASEEKLLDGLEELFEKVFSLHSQLIKEIKWNAGVPLSGGMGSRLIALELSRREVPSAAFSCGTTGFQDLIIASKAAAELGIPFKEIIWEDQKPWSGRPYNVIVKAIGFTTRYSLGTGAFAIIDADRGASQVFMPGHGGDFVSGSYILDVNLLAFDHETAALAVFTQHKRLINEELRSIFPWASSHQTEIRSSFLDTLKNQDDQSPLSLTLRWDLEQRQRRLIMRECEVYKLSGSQVMLPFWDYEVIDYFSDLPRKYLYKQYLYRRLMHERIFTGKYAGLGDIDTPQGPIKPLTTIRDIPGRLSIAQKLAWSVFGKSKPTPGLPDVLDSYDNLWYHSPGFSDYFLNLLQDSPQCLRLFKLDVINKLLKQADANLITETLSGLATLAHPIFNDYE